MQLSYLIKLAREGELSSVSKIKFTDDAVMGFIYLAMVELYKRFTLSTRIEAIDIVTQTPIYTVRNPLLNNIITVYTSTGKELREPVLVGNEDYEYTKLSFNTILLKNPYDEKLFVLFQSAPSPVNNINDELEIPPVFIESLLHYVGYRAHLSVTGALKEEHNTHYNRFEKSCATLHNLGHVVDVTVYNHPITQKGFI